jgi:hypothetical protein
VSEGPGAYTVFSSVCSFLEQTTTTVVQLCDLPLIKQPKIPNVRRSLDIGVASKPVQINEMDEKIIADLAQDPCASLAQMSR